jgi:putative hydrolase of the HAD superfamily
MTGPDAPASGRRVEAVTFDFWNTLCVPDHDRFRDQRMSAMRQVLHEDGVDVTDDALREAFVGLLELFNERWAANVQFVAADAAEIVADRLDPAMPTHVRVRLADIFASAPGIPDLASHAGEVVATLAGAGVRLGIICDVGMTPSPVLRSYLDHHGILQHFDHCSFSDEVGVYKPHRAIFDHALAGLGGVDPTRAAHIGDLRRTDVAGALDLGILAIRYRGVHDDRGDVGDVGELVEADHVIDDHRELPALLGLA